MSTGNYFSKTSTLQKFTHNFWSVLSLIIISLFGVIALFSYALAPDSTQNANQMHLSIHSKPPGFSVKMLKIPLAEKKEQTFFSKFIHGDINFQTEIPFDHLEITKNHLLVYPYFIPNGVMGLPKKIPFSKLQNLSTLTEIKKSFTTTKTFRLGTDKYGRDLLSRLLIGSRISFSIGFIAVLISLIIGVLLGALAGYFGGVLDAIIMWVINVVWSIPTLLLVIAITLALGKGLFQVYILA